MYMCVTPPRKDHPVHGSDLQKITDLIERHELGKPAMLGSFDNGPSSSGVVLEGGSGRRPSSASSGAVEAEAPPLQSGPRRSLRLVWQSNLLTNVPRDSRLTT